MNFPISVQQLVSYDLDKKLVVTPWCVKQNVDDLREIANWRFETEGIATLAATLWLNTPKEKRNVNEFHFILKHVLLMLGINDSAWCQ